MALRLFRWLIAGILLAVVAVVATIGFRANRTWRIVSSFEEQIRYAIANGESVAETPAGEALAVGYLESIFGDNPELLGKLKGVVQRGLEDTPALNLGEVAAMVVTYRRDDTGTVHDVVAHVLGGFPLGKRKPGFHRDGYFRHLVEPNVWNLGNAVISVLGRDMIMFAEEETADEQQRILESLFVYGDVMPLVESIDGPLHYTAVFPDPKRILPLELRSHVQAVVAKGYLSPIGGQTEIVLLTPSPRSASYALGILSDMKTIGEIALKTKWKAVPQETPWGTVVDTWWAYEMVKNSEQVTFEKQFNILRIKSEFDRVMVNVVIKSIERMGRDLAQMKGSLDERLDPRLVDARLFAAKPQHYWSDSHRWGPEWPFRGQLSNEVTVAESTEPAAPAAAPAVPAGPEAAPATQSL